MKEIKPSFQKELQYVREISKGLINLSSALNTQANHRRDQDYSDLTVMPHLHQHLILESKRKNELLLLENEVSMSMINVQARKRTIRKRLFSRLMDERGIIDFYSRA